VQYSWPRAYILIWNFCLFWVVVIYGQRERRLYQLCLHGFIAIGVLIALVAPLGMAWLYKFPLLERLLQQIPTPLLGVFAGAESGFHPNQVAGTLLYVLPLALALAAEKVYRRERSVQSVWWVVASLVMVGVLLLTQSRAGLVGLGIGAILMLLWPWQAGRWLLLFGVVVGVMTLPWLPSHLFDIVGNSPTVAVSGGNSLGFRQEVWLWATTGLYDFPFTGMGLGTFRQIVFLLYPINIDPNYNLGHAHHFFLQTGLDVGIPGLIGVLALYWGAIYLLLVEKRTPITRNGLTLGLFGSLIAQTVYSQFDAVTLGAKTNVFFWWLLALIYATIYITKR
jgi:O-antigen ligase